MFARPTLTRSRLFVYVATTFLMTSISGIADCANVYKTRVEPNWAEDGNSFWYVNKLADGKREYVRVDALKGKRNLAFDHTRLAEKLSANDIDTTQNRLAIDHLEFSDDTNAMIFDGFGHRWECSLTDYSLKKVTNAKVDTADAGTARVISNPRSVSRRSNGEETSIRFENALDEAIELFWINGRQRVSYGQVKAGKTHDQHTFGGHVWEASTLDGKTIAFFEASDDSSVAIVRKGLPVSEPRRRPSRRRRVPQNFTDNISPDGKWRFVVRDNKLMLQPTDDDEEAVTVAEADKGQSFEMTQWSPDSKALISFRVTPGENKLVHLIESSPKEAGRAKLSSRPYPLPGDRFTSRELVLVDVQKKEVIRTDTQPVDFYTPRVRWSKTSDGSARFTYQKVDRGHQRFRLIEVDCHNGDSRNIIDEETDTFIWTAHTENIGVRPVTWLEKTNEIIYASEKDGWRHLYLIDPETGNHQQITKGDWVVRGIEKIDEEKRTILFRASGLFAAPNGEQDPYFIHYCRVNFNGSGFVALTEGNGTHSIEFSPDGRFLIDRFSRIDMAPAHELRSTDTGELVCKLESADMSELNESGWPQPEVFVSKGRDNKTDIWGFICRPKDFDPNKQYPIIEDIYAGPHSAHVPKRFSPSERYRELTELGFIVVKIDGMGTAHRSKSFHDVCWHNLKDAGFPDRIRWIKAAAKKYPYMDTSRVGIYGTSAGGQNAAGALLFHGAFYKAAVASCGCHDNRMDKASWNEQWMGYPVGPQYAASSNIDNAHRLTGKLLLIVGEMDRNVPPESTMRFVNALVKANKDFELLVLPGVGHSSGGGYGQRRRLDFFVRHLQGIQPPDRNQEAAADSTTNSVPRSNNVQPTERVLTIRSRYLADRSSLQRFYNVLESPTRHARLSHFYNNWKDALTQLNQTKLSSNEKSMIAKLVTDIEKDQSQADRARRRAVNAKPFIPFANSIIELTESRQRVDPVDPQTAAATISRMLPEIERSIELVENGRAIRGDAAKRNARLVGRLRDHLSSWNDFYAGYNPSFSWWMKSPHKKADKALNKLARTLKKASKEKARNSVTGKNSAAQKLTVAKEFTHQDISTNELEIILDQPDAKLPALIRRYSATMQDRRMSARRRQPPPFKKFLAELRELEFNSLARSDQVDYLLLRNELEYRIARQELSGNEDAVAVPQDDSGIPAFAVGPEALRLELNHELIPYSPEELIRIAEQEYQFCLSELKKASTEMGFGNDWKKAVEKVKSMHVAPGHQPKLIRELAVEAVDYLKENQSLTIPPIAEETWRMQMMTPERQLVNPFFTGGEVISVSFPTDSMAHQDKLQSMRGNNIPFARATVHHELIPGHHLQAFMNNRNHAYRSPFRTPFWTEGWALYWEMVLYAEGFRKHRKIELASWSGEAIAARGLSSRSASILGA